MSPSETRSAFVSHSTPDDHYVEEFVQLVRGLGYDEVFKDSHSILPDEYFWEKIEEGIRGCDAFVVILSHASVESYWVDKEVQFAREQKKRVIPVRIDDCRLPSSFDGRDVIELWQGRGDKLKVAPSRILKHSPPILFGRETELADLDTAWDSGTNVYTLVAWGGVGKTSLVAHWVAQRFMQPGWPQVEHYFDWSFYSQGTGESRQTSADLFINEALKFFGDPDPTLGNPYERGERLVRLVRRHRTLLVLDGIEPLQYPPADRSGQAGRLKDPALEVLLQGLAAENPGLCVVTTREHLTNIESLPTTREQKLDKLEEAAAAALLRHLQIVGSDEELQAAWEAAGGHALTLQLLGRFIVRAYPDRDIRHFRDVGFEAADRQRQGRSAFKVMQMYERWLESGGEAQQRELAILRLTGLFDRPISPGCLTALRAEPAIPGLTDTLVPLSDVDWNLALSDLADLDLITLTPTSDPSVSPSPGLSLSLDAHPLVREYFEAQLKQQAPEAFRAAHSRLFDHLCETAPECTRVSRESQLMRRFGLGDDDEEKLPTLEDLQPLYQAVTHGCLAGRHEEAQADVYRDRILRGTGSDGFYSRRKLGAIGADLGAIAAFFETPWSRVSKNLKEASQAWLLNEAVFRLQALGRLTEALETARVVLERDVAVEAWKDAGISASSLSRLELTLGRLADAVADGRRAIDFADRSGNSVRKMIAPISAADALHQTGNREEAAELFAAAEQMQADWQPPFPLLYSVRGFQYVDLILGPAEQAAWQAVLSVSPSPPLDADHQDRLDRGGEGRGEGEIPAAPINPSLNSQLSTLNSVCDEATRRAKQGLEIAKHDHLLLDIALDRLTLVRAGLYRALLSGDVTSSLGAASTQAADAPSATPSAPVALAAQADAALAALRQAGQVDYVPKALLTAALAHATLSGDPDRARQLLDEAEQIARRGPMPLHLADVHLHRARLFRDKSELDQARTLIEQHGYWRRREELTDAETAAAEQGWT